MIIHCSGIGGIGLSAYAAHMNAAGHTVSAVIKRFCIADDLRSQRIQVSLAQMAARFQRNAICWCTPKQFRICAGKEQLQPKGRADIVFQGHWATHDSRDRFDLYLRHARQVLDNRYGGQNADGCRQGSQCRCRYQNARTWRSQLAQGKGNLGWWSREYRRSFHFYRLIILLTTPTAITAMRIPPTKSMPKHSSNLSKSSRILSR